jgi:hypothetical protein
MNYKGHNEYSVSVVIPQLLVAFDRKLARADLDCQLPCYMLIVE